MKRWRFHASQPPQSSLSTKSLPLPDRPRCERQALNLMQVTKERQTRPKRGSIRRTRWDHSRALKQTYTDELSRMLGCLSNDCPVTALLDVDMQDAARNAR